MKKMVVMVNVCDCKLYNGEGEYCNDGSCDLCEDCYEKHYAKCKSCKCE